MKDIIITIVDIVSIVMLIEYIIYQIKNKKKMILYERK